MADPALRDHVYGERSRAQREGNLPMEQTHDVVASDPGSVVEAGPVAEAERLVGTVEELWRYPVKSMLGGKVSELLVTEQGGLGDRAWALRDQRNGRIVSAKRVPRLLDFRAAYDTAAVVRDLGVVGAGHQVMTA
jgi:hypothetical protein